MVSKIPPPRTSPAQRARLKLLRSLFKEFERLQHRKDEKGRRRLNKVKHEIERLRALEIAERNPEAYKKHVKRRSESMPRQKTQDRALPKRITSVVSGGLPGLGRRRP